MTFTERGISASFWRKSCEIICRHLKNPVCPNIQDSLLLRTEVLHSHARPVWALELSIVHLCQVLSPRKTLLSGTLLALNGSRQTVSSGSFFSGWLGVRSLVAGANTLRSKPFYPSKPPLTKKKFKCSECFVLTNLAVLAYIISSPLVRCIW